MIDITQKIDSLRTAKAQAIIRVSPASTEAIKNNTVPKGDVFATAKTAGMLAVKQTPNLLPHCHPVPVNFCELYFNIDDKKTIKVEVTVKSIYKTGCEMEALHGASVAALTVYDMLKPIDKAIEITNIKLVEKSGGKSDFAGKAPAGFKAAVIVCSDSIAAGKKEDKAGKAIIRKLEECKIEISGYKIIPDTNKIIKDTVMKLCKTNNIILITGGTGLSPRDNTPETVRSILDREVPGIMEASRNFGQQRTPYAMLSRGIAGFRDKTLILALPGSTKGAEESMNALFPYVLHVFKVLDMDFRHEPPRRNL